MMAASYNAPRMVSKLSSSRRYPVRHKLVMLAVGALVASVIALPATAAGPGKRQGPKKPIPAVCLQAAKAGATAFHQQQKARRVEWRTNHPNATGAERGAFAQSQRAALKGFHEQQKAAMQACVAN